MAEFASAFDHPLGEAHYDRYRPGDVEPALDAAEGETRAALDELPNRPDVLRAFCDAFARFDFVVAIAADLGAVLGGDWTAVSTVAARRAEVFHAEVFQRTDLRDALVAAPVQDVVEQRLRDDLVRRFEHAGVGLDAGGRARVASIQARLATLGAAFSDNLTDADRECELVLDGRTIPYSESAARRVLQFGADRGEREHAYRAMVGRAAGRNRPVVAEILTLRQQYAELLGHRNLVELRRSGCMVTDPQALLDELASAYRPQAEREHAELLEFARESTGDPGFELTAADVDLPFDGYWAMRLREARGLNSGTEVRVPVRRVVEVMLDALAELYPVRFTRSDAPVWHADVRAYDVHDHSGRHLARICCDWYARDGKRPYGAWMSGPHVDTDGGPHLATVVSNVSGPDADLFDMRVMWHEFGHAMHLAFTRTRFRLRGPDDCAPDFIEAPSRIMENWPLAPEILRRMGVSLDAATAAAAEERFRVASRKLNRLARPAIDLAMHRGEDPRAVKQRYLLVPVDPDDATEAHFHHVFAGTYAAVHYAYQWAGVLAADLFTRFAAEGVLDPSVGAAYAQTVLAPGAELDPTGTVRAFLGRDVTLEALLEQDRVTRVRHGPSVRTEPA